MDAIIIRNANVEEITALVWATQRRQTEENFIPLDAIKEAVRQAMSGTAEA